MQRRKNMKEKRIYCKKCKHFYVTWDMKFPNGCRLYGIKAKQQPSVLVYQSIGKRCDKFKLRDCKNEK